MARDPVELAAGLAERLMAARPSAFPLLIAEAGARKPQGRELTFERCYALPHRRILAFEADTDEAQRLSAAFGAHSGVEVVAAALGAAAGRARLYLTKARKCSSLYEPDATVVARYRGIEAIATDRVVDIEVTTLAEVSRARGLRGLDFLKLDIQGAELQVLQGAGTLLDEVGAIVTEVSFVPVYRGQPLFADIQQYLTTRGFELYHFVHLGDLSRTAAGGSQLAWGDALFVRAPESVSGDAAARLAVFAALYSAHDVAEVALRRTEGAEAVLAWFAHAVQPGAADASARRLMRAIGRRLQAPAQGRA